VRQAQRMSTQEAKDNRKVLMNSLELQIVYKLYGRSGVLEWYRSIQSRTASNSYRFKNKW